MVEYERTFLVAAVPEGMTETVTERITDVFFPLDVSQHPRLRFRNRGGNCECTKKVQVTEGDASAHVETTIPLSVEEWSDVTAGSDRRVTKDRISGQLGGRSVDVDVFGGDLAGLILLDVEFDEPASMEAYAPPVARFLDVTQEDFIAGGLLAGKTYASLQAEFERLGWSYLTA